MSLEAPPAVSNPHANDVGAKRKTSRLLRWLKLLLKSKTGTLGFFIVFIVFFIALLAPLIAPCDPAEIDAAKVLTPPCWAVGGLSGHILGTDNLGRDIFSRIIFGSRVSLLVGICSVFVAGFIGLSLGLLAGFYGGMVDNLIMRVVDSFLAIPSILFTLVFLSVVGPGTVTLTFIIGFTHWTTYCRVIRAEVLGLKEREFVKAARSIGVRDINLILRHILPNVFSSFIVISTLSVAINIILEASLSFLGLGIQPPTVSWGGMLSDGRNYLASHWWIATFPGLAITITVLGIIFLGDWLRDVLDPRSRGQRS
jgi:peptide/nickel transport system permease protein